MSDGTLHGLIDVDDDRWQNGELFSCPRTSIQQLLEMPETNRYGVYLLLSQSKVYVGQASNLKTRINQHIIGKDWWERVILLTTKDDNFTRTDIDYLESVLIEKSLECGTLDTDNKNKGNKQKVDKFRQHTLDDYVKEAFFVLELIGVSVFTPKAQKELALVNTVPVSNPEAIELRHKGEVGEFARKQGLNIEKDFSYASIQEKKKAFWINPKVECPKSKWQILLNNQSGKILYFFEVPAGTFEVGHKAHSKVLLIRKDRNIFLDMLIDEKTFVDRPSNCDFSPYLIKKIKY